jgi:hypothetical protein
MQGATATTCAPMPTGALCTTTDDCIADLEFCGADGICRPRLAVGQECAGQVTPCVLLAQCDRTTQTCVPAGKMGQACGPLDFCWDGVCDVDPLGTGTGTHTCIPYHAAGDACVESYQCASEICGESHTCVPCAL